MVFSRGPEGHKRKQNKLTRIPKVGRFRAFSSTQYCRQLGRYVHYAGIVDVDNPTGRFVPSRSQSQPIKPGQGQRRGILHSPMRIQTHLLPTRIGMDVIVRTADDFRIDRRGEAGLGQYDNIGHGLNTG